MQQPPLHIKADFREKRSGIPEILKQQDIELEMCHLRTGDYMINDLLIIERKSANDLVISIIDTRLFKQCSRMKQRSAKAMIIIEGNPYQTVHKISPNAIKGALLSMTAVWQVPVMLTKNAEETAKLIVMAGRQLMKNNSKLYNGRSVLYKPKTSKRRRVYFLTGLPSIGVVKAEKLLDRFGSIRSIITASSSELTKVEGIGRLSANRLRDFIESV